MLVLDKIDKQILELLQHDARITNKELSAKLGLSTTPIFERVKKLERNGYIKGYVALVDPKKINRKLTSFISVSLKQHTNDKIKVFMNQVNKFSEVMECYHIAGQTDFIAKIVVEDMESYQKFIVNNFSKLDNISQIQSNFVMSELKNTTAYQFDELNK
jgi:DNA-binding Lrp family transcriptional regulator